MDAHTKGEVAESVELREIRVRPATVESDDAVLGRLGKKSVLKVRMSPWVKSPSILTLGLAKICFPLHSRFQLHSPDYLGRKHHVSFPLMPFLTVKLIKRQSLPRRFTEVGYV